VDDHALKIRVSRSGNSQAEWLGGVACKSGCFARRCRNASGVVESIGLSSISSDEAWGLYEGIAARLARKIVAEWVPKEGTAKLSAARCSALVTHSRGVAWSSAMPCRPVPPSQAPARLSKIPLTLQCRHKQLGGRGRFEDRGKNHTSEQSKGVGPEALNWRWRGK